MYKHWDWQQYKEKLVVDKRWSRVTLVSLSESPVAWNNLAYYTIISSNFLYFVAELNHVYISLIAFHPLVFSQGGDDVMGCVHDDNGRVRIHHFYNVGQWAKEIKRNPARDEEGVFENNRVTCRFKRPLYVPREETLVDLHLSWYYLFAWGPAIQGDRSSVSVKSTVFLLSFFLLFVSSYGRLAFFRQVPSRGMTSTIRPSVTTWSASISTRTSSCLLRPTRPSTLPSAYCS